MADFSPCGFLLVGERVSGGFRVSGFSAGLPVRTLPWFLSCCLMVVSLICGCTDSGPSDPESTGSTGERGATLPPKKFEFRPRAAAPITDVVRRQISFPRFTDVAAELGVQHVFDNGASPKALMVESTGGGCGWGDFDRDGRIDVYLTQGAQPCPSPADMFVPDALYRQGVSGRFTDCFAVSGIEDSGFGHGVAVGDFDNDGFDDLFVSNAGVSRLFLNLGDGTFQDATGALEGARRAWSSTSAWGDPDRDGDLDLYVCNYAIYDPCNPVECLDKDGIPSICHPRNVEAEPDMFFRNEGDGRFVECSKERGLFGPGNKALGVVIADLTGDGWPDIYVANDTTANFFFVNDGTGRFRESAQLLGGAFSSIGEPQASMGVAFGDYDRNSFPDLLLTHFTGESNTLYQNRGAQGLFDVSHLTGLREPSLPKLGFGTVMSDFNADGGMDLFVTNGHIDPRYAESEGYEMVPQLFSWDGQLWQERPEEPGDFFTRRHVGRAVGTADFDDDGDLDMCVVHHNAPAALLRNDSQSGRLVKIRLLGVQSNRNGYNTSVTMAWNDQRLVQELPGGTSYAATHERVLCFAPDNTSETLTIEVRWPSGQVQKLSLDARVNSVVIQEGVSGYREF